MDFVTLWVKLAVSIVSNLYAKLTSCWLPANIVRTVSLCPQLKNGSGRTPKTATCIWKANHETQVKSHFSGHLHIFGLQICMFKCQFLLLMNIWSGPILVEKLLWADSHRVLSFPHSIKVHLDLTSKTLQIFLKVSLHVQHIYMYFVLYFSYKNFYFYSLICWKQIVQEGRPFHIEWTSLGIKCF